MLWSKVDEEHFEKGQMNSGDVMVLLTKRIASYDLHQYAVFTGKYMTGPFCSFVTDLKFLPSWLCGPPVGGSFVYMTSRILGHPEAERSRMNTKRGLEDDISNVYITFILLSVPEKHFANVQN